MLHTASLVPGPRWSFQDEINADLAKVFRGEGRRLDIFAWLFPHINSKGYFYWFKAFQLQVDQWIDSSKQEKE